MKQFITALLAIYTNAQQDAAAAADGDGAVARVGGSSSCLYCRNQDLNAGFLVSYSFCEH